MTDIVLGMGEVGSTLFELLTQRGIDCVGIDSDKSKCRNYSENNSTKSPEFLHVCIPGELNEFIEITTNWIKKFKDLQAVVIHSTVIPGTTKSLQDKFDLLILFSPVRGVHRRFLDDIKKYTKFFASDKIEIDSKIKLELEKRFQKIQWMSTTKTAELAKILVDTTYYGWLINYAQITKMICDKEKIDFDEMWKFADEIHENLGNRPKMYPGIIGGHCVIPNLSLAKYDNLDIIKKINELYKNYSNDNLNN
ncbi:MAG: NAD-binding protein [Nitrosarchaeum sp.]